MLNAQLPLSCIAAFTHNTESECRTYCSHTKPIPYSNAIDQMVPHLQFAIHLHLAHIALKQNQVQEHKTNTDMVHSHVLPAEPVRQYLSQVAAWKVFWDLPNSSPTFAKLS